MKELIVGDIAIYTEDDDSWDDLIKVVKKANKACLETIKKESLLARLRKRWKI